MENNCVKFEIHPQLQKVWSGQIRTHALRDTRTDARTYIFSLTASGLDNKASDKASEEAINVKRKKTAIGSFVQFLLDE